MFALKYGGSSLPKITREKQLDALDSAQKNAFADLTKVAVRPPIITALLRRRLIPRALGLAAKLRTSSREGARRGRRAPPPRTSQTGRVMGGSAAYAGGATAQLDWQFRRFTHEHERLPACALPFEQFNALLRLNGFSRWTWDGSVTSTAAHRTETPSAACPSECDVENQSSYVA
ncbi:hypothetical protein EXIGLDRAFT_275093 [Exidia glandulosa HHB12029]|uniref:Uncharacterized protein n=1 Tax=Exidia glandulosa HHB12029 TaxID=1314781 RepID=A0A165M824_EXIGL|nr:hypothetical protein EXIGLDRAFT_275093 [Exidia glandulosa HHB12029]